MFYQLVYSPFHGYVVTDAIPSVDFKVCGSLLAFLRLSVKEEDCFLACGIYRRQLNQTRAYLCDSFYDGKITLGEFSDLIVNLTRLQRAYNEVFNV